MNVLVLVMRFEEIYFDEESDGTGIELLSDGENATDGGQCRKMVEG